jgi:hypothetical protein
MKLNSAQVQAILPLVEAEAARLRKEYENDNRHAAQEAIDKAVALLPANRRAEMKSLLMKEANIQPHDATVLQDLEELATDLHAYQQYMRLQDMLNRVDHAYINIHGHCTHAKDYITESHLDMLAQKGKYVIVAGYDESVSRDIIQVYDDNQQEVRAYTKDQVKVLAMKR